MTVNRRRGASTYRYDFWLNGKRHNASTGLTSKQDAEQFEATLKQKLRRRAAGLEAADASDTPTFSNWADITYKWQRDRKKLKRADEAKKTLRMILAFWGQRPATKPVAGGVYKNLRLGDPIAEPELIEAFEQWMTVRGISGPRKNHYRSACSMLYRVALMPHNRRLSGIRENPFMGVLRDKVTRRTAVLEVEDVMKLLEHAPLPVAIGVGLGLLSPALRLKNVVDLRRDQVSRDLTVLMVPHKADRETGLPLAVAISPGLSRVLKRVYEQFPGDDYVVPMTGERYWQFVKLMRRAVMAAGLPYGRKVKNGVTFHSLRHAISTWLARWRVSTAEAQKAMGHETSAMAEWYRHLAGIDMAPTMAMIDTRVPVAATLERRLEALVSPAESPAKAADSRPATRRVRAPRKPMNAVG